MCHPKLFFLLRLATSVLCCLLFFSPIPAQAIEDSPDQPKLENNSAAKVKLIILGNAQDAGYPQAACKKKCCKPAWEDHKLRRFATCIAVIDQANDSKLLFECTPNFPDQMQMLDKLSKKFLKNDSAANESKPRGAAKPQPNLPDGIFLTHAHIGHYAGLIHLGREVIGSKSIPVHVMPGMRKFLIANGPWSQLVQLKNIVLRPLIVDQGTKIGRISVTPILVPHRDEYSETVGFRITGPTKSALFLPDIDKWEKWERKIENEIKKVDFALIDGTFFGDGELPGRDMKKIPHPFIEESIARFSSLPDTEKKKIFFIHFNHTNPALQKDSDAQKKILAAGFKIAEQGSDLDL